MLDDSVLKPYASSASKSTRSPRRKHMRLLTPELRSQLPPLYRQEHNKDPIVHVKFFCPWSNGTWFATEGATEDDDFRFFGYVIGFDEEWGYFVLSEMEEIR